MSPTEAVRVLTSLFQLLAVLAVLAGAVTLARYSIERRTRILMRRHVGNLVGKRAVVVSDLRAGRAGRIRPLDGRGRQAGQADKGARYKEAGATFPATADQLISRGRVVRVTGGDADGYLVRPLEKER